MNKKIKALLLALTMAVGLLLTACGNTADDVTEAPEQTAGGYQVKVVDAFGQPCTKGVIVRFMQDGQQVSMQVVDDNGTVTKDLEKGEYTVELQFTDKDAAYYYDQRDLTLTPEKTSLQIALYSAIGGEPTDINAYSLLSDTVMGMDAYAVNAGGTYVELVPGERNYFLFTPVQSGTYEITVENAEAALGYYGAPHFVQQTSATEVVDNKLVISIKDSMIGVNGTGTSVLVLGLDAADSDSAAILKIQRTGDPQWDVTDEPWTVYESTITLQPYVHPAGATLGEFDLTAASDAYKLVLGSDQYYHLDSEDGPLVVVRLGKVSGGSKYLDPFQTILEHSGVSKYFFDEEGNFLKKETYDQCLLEYFDYMDEESGLYPLTEDLKYIIQMRGDHYGWYSQGNPGYIFLDANGNPVPGINHDISWLFMCAFIR